MKEIDIRSLTLNPFERLHKQWALLAAGNAESFNMMTVSWGALGVIWQKPSCTVYVRGSRYTKEFIDNSEYFTGTGKRCPCWVRSPAATLTR